MSIPVRISIRRTVTVLGLALGLLTVAHLTILPRMVAMEGRPADPLVGLLNLNGEANLPTWFSAMLLFCCAMLLALLSLAAREQASGDRRHWMALAVGFLALSIDEIAGLHERLSDVEDHYVNFPGFLSFSWVVPASVVLLVALLAFRRFVFRLPPLTRWLFILSGALFIGGAVGMEMVGGQYGAIHGFDNLPYRAITTVKKVLQLSGTLLFMYALLARLRDLEDVIVLRFSDEPHTGIRRHEGTPQSAPGDAERINEEDLHSGRGGSR